MNPSEPRTLADLQREHGLPPVSRRRAPHGELTEQSALRNYVRDLVLGFNDGLVSVFAVTAGVAGAALESRTILIAGVAAAIAGALSMGVGEYISTKSQAEFYRSERRREEEHLTQWPELERQELRDSFEAKGLRPPLLDEVVEAIASDRDRFLDYMMRDEFGVGQESERSPIRAGGIVIAAFLVGSAFPLLPYATLDPAGALRASMVASLSALFLAGVARARASRLPALRAGIEMVVLGALAAGITYAVGRAIGVAV